MVQEILCAQKREKARELKFLGSPSICVNGYDVEPGADQRKYYGMG